MGPNSWQGKGLALNCSHLRVAVSDGVIFLVPAEQDCGLEEIHPPPKPSHVQQEGTCRNGLSQSHWGLSISSGF